ncbi:MAG TPA: hypothetical protein VMF90_11320 [Rhizobiaceae bacterium]|nr:hypothetical protein [Rhizobiaceae bacterium]
MSGDPEIASFMPDPAKVEAMTGYGLSPEQVAKILRIDVGTLEATCGYEIETGHLKANARVAENLYRKATSDSREAVAAAIFWLKSRARWKETVVQEHTSVQLLLNADDRNL